MEIPLKLSCPGPERLVYGFPSWYRAVMAAILAALALGSPRPGPLGWTAILLVVLGGLYD